MKKLSHMLLSAGLALSVAVIALPVSAQQGSPEGQARPIKPASPAAIAYAKEILAMKNASAMYANAVPNMVQRVKDSLLQSNLNYQKDLNEVAITIAQTMAGRDKEITEQMAKIYASDFTEAELKDLATFYKSPLGQKLLVQEPQSISASMTYMQQWAQQFSEQVNGLFRAEMRKRGKEI
ncbi:DUF2059 domain-containing protein [Tardiphaga sp. 37S4]|uniref:DUF2059 domain-containing protein n=1 Tax=Tardiphaga sp. 37S4 TaxID=1404741 RepID=UPI001E32E5E5|nr:DUF2059 domain-containing protein [Tardiphaga sp. 37S4]UFS78473.1 DUF2059 domain-containing protein [Tardiphaga sp. 37S4]